MLHLLADMRADGLQPNSFCYNAAITACARARRWRQGIAIMHEMEDEAEATGDPSVAPTVHTYSAVMKACAAGGQWRTAHQLIGRMERQGLEPNSFHYGCVIDACGRCGEVDKVMKLMMEMQSNPRVTPPSRPNRRPCRVRVLSATPASAAAFSCSRFRSPGADRSCKPRWTSR